jgi:hypothetical protein
VTTGPGAPYLTALFAGRCGKLAELDLDTSEIDRNSKSRRQRAVKFPTSPLKKRGEIPALVAGEDNASLAVQSGGRKKLIWTSLSVGPLVRSNSVAGPAGGRARRTHRSEASVSMETNCLVAGVAFVRSTTAVSQSTLCNEAMSTHWFVTSSATSYAWWVMLRGRASRPRDGWARRHGT